jgi:chromosome segregation ATPase
MSIDFNRIRDIIQIERAKLLSLNDIDAVLEMLRAGETDAKNLELRIEDLKKQVANHENLLKEVSVELVKAQQQAEKDKIELREGVAKISGEVMAERTKIDKQIKDAQAKHAKVIEGLQSEVDKKTKELADILSGIAAAEGKIAQYKADIGKLLGGSNV